MVRYRRYYKKNNRVTKKQFNYIAKNYLKYKININQTISWQTSIAWDSRTGDSLTAENIFETAGNEFLTLRKYYASYKITGIAIDVIPAKSGSSNGLFTIQGLAYLGLIQTGETVSLPYLTASPHCMTLNPDQRVRKYIKLNTAWTSTAENAGSMFKLSLLSGGSIVQGSVVFSVRISLYITFKNPL